MPSDALSELASSGTLRAAINMANTLLVTGSTSAGDPEGVAPEMARAIANRLCVEVSYVPFASPGELADAVDHGRRLETTAAVDQLVLMGISLGQIVIDRD